LKLPWLQRLKNQRIELLRQVHEQCPIGLVLYATDVGPETEQLGREG
jgi:hypothetical protein